MFTRCATTPRGNNKLGKRTILRPENRFDIRFSTGSEEFCGNRQGSVKWRALSTFAKPTTSHEFSHNSDDLAHHLGILWMAETNGTIELLRRWVDHQGPVFNSAATA
jgi:hypothetical protein